jgi:isopentenyldiphosphate isomerase
MEKKRALLVVAGGRIVPDVLALYGIQPHLVVILTSIEGWKDESTFREVVASLPDHEEIGETIHVNAYDFEAAKIACIEACRPYSDTEWDWTFSMSSSPKIMGIAAYEVARQKKVPCLHIDTQHEKIVSLVEDIRKKNVFPNNLFHMDVDTYMKFQQRQRKAQKQQELQYRRVVEQWEHIADILARSFDTPLFTKLMRDKAEKQEVTLSPSNLACSPLIQDLIQENMIKLAEDPFGGKTCAFTSKNAARFLGKGDWLELYVWSKVKVHQQKFADDCQWGYVIKSTAENELDVVFTHKSQLIFVECKTDENPFFQKTRYLDGINNKAAMLGGSYVTKIFVTNASKVMDGYENFKEQAKLREIVIATGEDLPNIGNILEKEAKNPTYARR